MGIDYAGLAKVADRMIGENGKTHQFKRAGSVTRVNGLEVVAQPSTFTVVGIVTSFNAHEINGSTIKAGDSRFVATRAAGLEIGDTVTIDGQVWRVEGPGPKRPADTLLCYVAVLRGVA